VVLSSVAGLAPVVGRPAYVASKHALTGAFEAVRAELAADGIGLTMVHPTFVTNELADVAGGTRSTTGALVTPDGVADAVVAAVAGGRGRVLPGRTARLADLVHRLSPRLYRRIMARRLAD
jgi:short-subunit dehydrogenase